MGEGSTASWQGISGMTKADRQFYVVVSPISYLHNGHVEKHLKGDPRYFVKTVEFDEWFLNPKWCDSWDYGKPDIIITEHTTDPHMPSVRKYAFREGIPVVVAVTTRDLPEYISTCPRFTEPYILLPIERWDIIGRVSMALGIAPLPISQGMVLIDYGLAVNFELGHVLIGMRKKVSLTGIQVVLLRYMFENVNKWLHVSELIRLPSFPEDAGNKSVARVISSLRSKIEEDKTFPQRILSNKRGYYMFHSKKYRQVDEITGWADLAKLGKLKKKSHVRSRGTHGNRNRLYR